MVTADELKRAKIFSCSDRAGGFTKWEWANETRLWRLLVSFKDPDHLKKVTAMLRAHKPIQPRPIYSGHFLKNRATKWPA